MIASVRRPTSGSLRSRGTVTCYDNVTWDFATRIDDFLHLLPPAALACTHARRRSRTHARWRARTHARRSARAHARRRARAYAGVHARTHARRRARTHTHTHARVNTDTLVSVALLKSTHPLTLPPASTYLLDPPPACCLQQQRPMMRMPGTARTWSVLAIMLFNARNY